MLDKDIRLLLLFQVDKTGNNTFYRIGSTNLNPKGSIANQKKLDDITAAIKKDLKIENGYFDICFERLPDLSEPESIKIITKDLFKDKKRFLINVAFPGELLINYDLENEKAQKEIFVKI